LRRSREHALLLLRKAGQDEYVVVKLLPDAGTPDEVLGFHLQQAIEKLLKAAVTNAGLEYEKTHDLAALMDLARGGGLEIPARFEEVRYFTAFATELRYEDTVQGSLDRKGGLALLQELRRWVEALLATSG